MQPSLRDSVFSRVKNSPKFLQFLAYLHAPPTHRLTPTQADYWTASLVDYYPESLRDDVTAAIAADPDRIVPLIPYILSKISAPEIVSELQISRTTTSFRTKIPCPDMPGAIFNAVNHILPPSTLPTPALTAPGCAPCSDDPFIEHGADPSIGFFCVPLSDSEESLQAEDIADPATPPSKGKSVDRSVAYSPSPLPPFRPAAGTHQGSVPLLPIRRSSPDRLPGGADVEDAGVLAPSCSGDSNVGRHPSRPVKMSLPEEVRGAVVFRMDRDMYHVSVPKLFVLSVACGFLIGAFSFLGLRALSYSPLGAVVGGFPLSLALILVVAHFISKEVN